jgi:hypothetical protein
MSKARLVVFTEILWNDPNIKTTLKSNISIPILDIWFYFLKHFPLSDKNKACNEWKRDQGKNENSTETETFQNIWKKNWLAEASGITTRFPVFHIRELINLLPRSTESFSEIFLWAFPSSINHHQNQSDPIIENQLYCSSIDFH